MNSIRAFADKNDSYVFDSELGFSDTFLRAIEDQTPAFRTKYARDELKVSLSEIATEMAARIAAADEEDE